MTNDTFLLTASDGIKVTVHRWMSEAKPSAVILLSHGMAEYAMRYDRFAEAAVKTGYAVYAPDHRGHGETAGSLDKLGYLADHEGFERVLDDLHELTLYINKQHPETPIILLGHSFGSFVSQMYLEKFGDLLAACVLSGTTGPNPVLVTVGRLAANLVAFLGGKKKPSAFLTNLSFGSYNKRIPGATSPNSWLSRDKEEVDKYDASPWAGFTCTAGFYKDLTHGLSFIHRQAAYDWIPRDLPIFLVSGDCDPVGSYGKTVRKLADIYRAQGLSRVKLTLYPGARHEILNETNRDEVTADILGWIASIVGPAI